MVTDRLRFVRWQRLLTMADEVNGILRARGVKETRAVIPKHPLPIFEEGSLEENPTLQDLWSTLLANAMDPLFNGELRYGFVEMIKNMTTGEVRLLDRFYDVLRDEGLLGNITTAGEHALSKENLMEMADMTIEQYQVSIHNLMRMQCFGPAILKSQMVLIGPEPITVYKGIDLVVLTPLGIRFIEACVRDAA